MITLQAEVAEHQEVMGLHLQVQEVTGEVAEVEGAEGVTEVLEVVKIVTALMAAAVTGEVAMAAPVAVAVTHMDHLEAAVDMEALVAAVVDMTATAVKNEKS